MAIKITKSGFFNKTFIFIDGDSKLGEMKLSWFWRASIVGESEVILGSDSFKLYREPKLKGKFVLSQNDKLIVSTFENNFELPEFTVHYNDNNYLLTRKDRLDNEFFISLNRSPCGSIYKDTSPEYFATLNVIDKLPIQVSVLCFWVCLFYWQGWGAQQAA